MALRMVRGIKWLLQTPGAISLNAIEPSIVPLGPRPAARLALRRSTRLATP